MARFKCLTSPFVSSLSFLFQLFSQNYGFGRNAGPRDLYTKVLFRLHLAYNAVQILQELDYAPNLKITVLFTVFVPICPLLSVLIMSSAFPHLWPRLFRSSYNCRSCCIKRKFSVACRWSDDMKSRCNCGHKRRVKGEPRLRGSW